MSLAARSWGRPQRSARSRGFAAAPIASVREIRARADLDQWDHLIE
jgi:hypothetical protein